MHTIFKKSDINYCQKYLSDQLKNQLPAASSITVGFQGGNKRGEAKHDDNLWFFLYCGYIGNRYWNAFGLKLNKNKNNHIVVEINSPVEGINRRIGGIFAEDGQGIKYLLHRGKIGGGRPGIGKNAFMKWFKGQGGKTIRLNDGDQINEAIIITALNDRHLVRNITYFVKQVAKFKG